MKQLEYEENCIYFWSVHIPVGTGISWSISLSHGTLAKFYFSSVDGDTNGLCFDYTNTNMMQTILLVLMVSLSRLLV